MVFTKILVWPSPYFWAMKKITAHLFIAISILGLAYVSLLAWWNPQDVMTLVGVTLPNTDALSSIRGIYGGAGTFVLGVMVYTWKHALKKTLLLLAAFWLLYAAARLITWQVDGELGDFGTKWLCIEATLGSLALLLAGLQKNP